MKKWIKRVILIVCICVFGYSAYNLYTIYSDKKEIEQETEKYKKSALTSKNKKSYLDPDWEKLQEENQNIIAWIYVPDCGISFPVVQGSDNSYYLTHSADGSENPRGAIFLDAGADAQFGNDNSLIYGHSVDGGGMFTDLKNFADESFFKKHPYFYLSTPQGNYRVNIMVFAKTTDGSVYYTTQFGTEQDSVLQTMQDQATFYREVDTTTGHFVTLSTCNLDYGFNSNQRYILTGVLEPVNEIEITD
ncbi:class B sortase [Catenisphaera adipataccumulans]|jgi:sortase B|uniref:Sortase B n=1 Tax=Catenisphaera adipataccumulans TaxID=700500 RepID=A0A7W8FXH5_9FIRM|nr:class B sortase [Catenisphaera adipataccumulans]MBB5182932.1 sortase B [Catenisphaera adipataccumulans]